MKKILRNTFAMMMLAAMTLLASVSAKADDCNKSVDKICDGYNAVAKQLKETSDIQALLGYNFIGEITKANNTVGEECYGYELNDEDRGKLIQAFDNVMNTLVDKANEFTDGQIGQMLSGQLKPMLDEYHSSVSETKTLGDYVTSMNE